MSKLFLKLKRKMQIARIVKCVLAGLAAGSFIGGILLLLSKLTLLPLAPIFALPIGVGVGIVVALLFFFLLRTPDQQLAETLDKQFALQEKVQTMIAYQAESGGMVSLQRQDAEEALANVPAKKLKIKRLWIYLTTFCVGMTALVGSCLVPDKRNQPEPPKPFAITEMQIAGLEELIRYVDESQMEELYREQLSTSLDTLLTQLKSATTEPQMQTALTEAMANIYTTTYNASSLTEILNALWLTEDAYAQGLATVLNTSAWKDPNWGDFAEKLTNYKKAFQHQPIDGEPLPSEAEMGESLLNKLEISALKIGVALQQSKITQTDALYVTVKQFSTEQQNLATNALPYQETVTAIHGVLDAWAQPAYEAISQLKINTNVGEYTMTKLATLFPVPLPRFERPERLNNNGNQGVGEDKPNDKGPSDGGIGEGATFGSKDLILDPLTGNYVEYGVLINKYYAVMNEKLETGNYSDEQKELIKNYFSLLYGGIEKEDGK